MIKVAVLFATGYEEVEALTVVDILRRAGIETTMVSTTKDILVESSHAVKIQTDILFENVNFDQYDMLVLPGGGRGVELLDQFEPLDDLLKNFSHKNKYIGAICAAPSILGKRGLLRGRKACSYPTFEKYLLDADIQKEPAVIDGKIITGRGMGCSTEFALSLVAVLINKSTAEELAKKIVKE